MMMLTKCLMSFMDTMMTIDNIHRYRYKYFTIPLSSFILLRATQLFAHLQLSHFFAYRVFLLRIYFYDIPTTDTTAKKKSFTKKINNTPTTSVADNRNLILLYSSVLFTYT